MCDQAKVDSVQRGEDDSTTDSIIHSFDRQLPAALPAVRSPFLPSSAFSSVVHGYLGVQKSESDDTVDSRTAHTREEVEV